MRIISILDWTINLIAIGAFIYFFANRDYENAKTVGIITIAFLILTLIRISIGLKKKEKEREDAYLFHRLVR